MNWNEIPTIRQWYKEQTATPRRDPRTKKPRLNAKQRQEIHERLRNGEAIKVLALDYNVSIPTIWRAKNELEL